MKKQLKLVLLLLPLLGILSVAKAQVSVSDYFSKLKTYEARFTQIVEQDGSITQQSTGKVSLKKPMQFRWDYNLPEKIQIISDGVDFYHYDIELAQATVKPASEIASSAIMLILDDQVKLDEIFDIKEIDSVMAQNRLSNLQRQGESFYLLTAKTKQADDLEVSQLILGFNTDKRLSVFFTEDQFGKTTFYFDKVKENKKLGNNEFKFIAPKGVDVLGG